MAKHHQHTVERVLVATRRAGRDGATLHEIRRVAETGIDRTRDILVTLEAAGFVRYDRARRVYTGLAPREGDDRRLADLVAGYKAATSRPGRPERVPLFEPPGFEGVS